MLHKNFQDHQPFGSREEFFMFYHIWEWWSCDLDHLNKVSFANPIEAPDGIWLQSAERFLRKRSLKMLNLSDLGPRSMNNLDLRYSFRFMYSFS